MQVKIKNIKEDYKKYGHQTFEDLPDNLKKAVEDSYNGTNLVYDYDKEDLSKFFEEVGVKLKL